MGNYLKPEKELIEMLKDENENLKKQNDLLKKMIANYEKITELHSDITKLLGILPITINKLDENIKSEKEKI